MLSFMGISRYTVLMALGWTRANLLTCEPRKFQETRHMQATHTWFNDCCNNKAIGLVLTTKDLENFVSTIYKSKKLDVGFELTFYKTSTPITKHQLSGSHQNWCGINYFKVVLFCYIT